MNKLFNLFIQRQLVFAKCFERCIARHEILWSRQIFARNYIITRADLKKGNIAKEYTLADTYCVSQYQII